MNERRTSVRVGGDLSTRTRTDGGELAFTSGGEVSEAGLFVEYVLPYPEGTRLSVDFVLPGVGDVSVQAVVASAQTFLPGDASTRLGNGLRFVDPSASARERIRTFIDRELT
jgi:hypothetical protein